MASPKCVGKSDDFVSNQDSARKVYSEPNFCQQCGRRFSTEMKLFTHMFTCSTQKRFREEKPSSSSKPFQCDICKSSFGQETNLRLHLLSHESETFSCETCLAEFPTLASLQKHCLVEHPLKKRKKSPAPKVSKRTQESKYTKEHKNDLVIEQGGESAPAQSKKDRDKVAKIRDHCLRFVNKKGFCCKHCGKFFAKENSHKRHELSHDFTQPISKRRPGYVKRIDTVDSASLQIKQEIDLDIEQEINLHIKQEIDLHIKQEID